MTTLLSQPAGQSAGSTARIQPGCPLQTNFSKTLPHNCLAGRKRRFPVLLLPGSGERLVEAHCFLHRRGRWFLSRRNSGIDHVQLATSAAHGWLASTLAAHHWLSTYSAQGRDQEVRRSRNESHTWCT